ncbi:MAG: hypothetical protein KDB63_07400 [Nocardioidaceae bacterium]|nr:hypothetical protein [Nocardioidaceae bacterium]
MDLHAFLDDDPRQVWALDRVTGASVYLEDGDAQALRPRTRSDLRCPYPDCVGAITTVGGEKRHHFRHLTDTTHPGGPESLHHVESKLMIADWFRRNATGARIQIESAVAGTDRRADVLVAPLDGRPLAVEVEYKSFTIEAALAKRADYQAAGVDCLWLLGHSRVRAWPDESGRVQLPAFAAVLVEDGARLLVVNPSTREIGTLGNHANVEARYAGEHTTARISIAPLAECWHETATTNRFIGTPADLRHDATARELAAQLAAQRAAQPPPRRPGFDWPRQPPLPRPEGAAEQSRRQTNGAAADALEVPQAWKAAIFASCVEGKPNWSVFTWSDITRAVARTGTRAAGRWSSAEFEGVRAWLELLEAEGWIFVVSPKEFAASGKQRPVAQGQLF